MMMMILRSLQVHRFRCLEEFRAEFGRGLNVVRGPNEAGKSTLQAAIMALLFEKPSLSKTAREGVESWHCDGLPAIEAEMETEDGLHELAKDFDNESAELVLPDGERITDSKQVRSRIAEIAEIGNEDIYMATACLRQQQWAQVTAGKDLRQLLQSNLTGGSEKAQVQNIIDDLDGQLDDLLRGVRGHAPKHPGPIARLVSRREELEEKLAGARQEQSKCDAARKKLQKAEREIAETEDSLSRKRNLQQQAERYLNLKEQKEKLRAEALKLQKRLDTVGDLKSDIEELSQQLQEGPDIDEQTKEDIERYKERKADVGRELESNRESLQELDGERDELQKRLKQLQEEAPSGKLLRKARGLENDARDAKAGAVELSEEISQKRDVLESAGRRRLLRNIGTGAGALIAIAGAALLSQSMGWIAAVIGGIAVAVGSRFIPMPADIDELTDEIDESRQQKEEYEQQAQQCEQELKRILEQVSCESITELADRVDAAAEKQDKLEGEIDKLCGQIENVGEMIEKQECLLEQLQENIDEILQKAGLDSVDEFLKQADAQRKKRKKIESKRERIAGLLGGETEEELQQRYNELALELQGVQEKLQKPEVQMGKMSRDEYQDLLQSIEELEGQLEDETEKRQSAEATIRAARYDRDDVTALEGEIEAVRHREELLRERVEVYQLARDAIADARDDAVASVTETIAPDMERLLGQLTLNRYSNVEIDSDMTPQLRVPDAGDYVALDDEIGGRGADLSWATCEQVFLASRLAIIDMVWPDGGPPLLLDDPLVNFDPARQQAAIDTIADAAKNHQVIVFTCSGTWDACADKVIEISGG